MVDNIPKQLRGEDLRFVLIKPKEKIPFEKDWQNTANYPWNHEKIKNHKGNVGILTGVGDIIVFDCDCREAENIARQLPATLVIGTSTTKDGYRKKHFYFKCSLKQKKILKDHDKHLGEIQAKGQQCLVPPSVHPSGSNYEILEENQTALLDEKLLQKMVGPFVAGEAGKPISVKELSKGKTEGDRNETAFRLATFHRKAGASIDETMMLIQGWNEKNEPPLPYNEIETIVRSAYRGDKPYGYYFKENPKKKVAQPKAGRSRMQSGSSQTISTWQGNSRKYSRSITTEQRPGGCGILRITGG